MAIQDDWTINYGAKTVAHSSGTTVYTVLAFFQWLASEFADPGQMDDDYPIVSDTPTVYRWINAWGFGNEAEDYKFLKGGGITSSDGDKLWSNLYSLGDQYRSSFIYVAQDGSELTPWWGVGNIDILILVKTGGILIDGGNVLVMSRDSDGLYDHNFVDLSGGGRNPVGINTFADLNYSDTGDFYLQVDSVTNFTAGYYVLGGTSGATARINYIDSDNNRFYCVMDEGGPFDVGGETLTETATRNGTPTGQSATLSAAGEVEVVASYDDINITFGDINRDLNNGNGPQPYKVEIDCAGRPMDDVYQYLKYICRHNSSTVINLIYGDLYRSANQGVYVDTKQAPFGTFAGGTFFGARGVWVKNYTAATFQLTDANNVQQLPPNYQKVICTHADLVGCQILVAEITGGNIIKNQYIIDVAGIDYITVTTSIDPNKTPQSGKLRVGDTIYFYGSFTGDTFNDVTPDPSAETGDLYVPFLDELADATTEQSDNIIYNGNVSVRIAVRKYGLKPFSQDATFGITGLSFSPILTPDPQAT